MSLPEEVAATVAEAERLGFAVLSVERGPFKAVDVETDESVWVERLTVVFGREGEEDFPLTWVRKPGGWQVAKGTELPS